MGFRDRDGRSMPGSVTLTGRLYDESTLLAVADAFQQATGDHLSGRPSSNTSPRKRNEIRKPRLRPQNPRVRDIAQCGRLKAAPIGSAIEATEAARMLSSTGESWQSSTSQ